MICFMTAAVNCGAGAGKGEAMLHLGLEAEAILLCLGPGLEGCHSV